MPSLTIRRRPTSRTVAILASEPNGRSHHLATVFSGWTSEGERIAAEDQATWIALACTCFAELREALEDLVERDRAEASASGFEDDEMSWLEDAKRALLKAKGCEVRS